MPIYEYECSECGVHFDKLQRLGEPSPDSCPNGHSQVHRLFSRPTIIFKGSGFYVTDHGRNGRGISSRSKRQNKASESASSSKSEREPES
jgi:putative FmdB family regulatory protein